MNTLKKNDVHISDENNNEILFLDSLIERTKKTEEILEKNKEDRVNFSSELQKEVLKNTITILEDFVNSKEGLLELWITLKNGTSIEVKSFVKECELRSEQIGSKGDDDLYNFCKNLNNITTELLVSEKYISLGEIWEPPKPWTNIPEDIRKRLDGLIF